MKILLIKDIFMSDRRRPVLESYSVIFPPTQSALKKYVKTSSVSFQVLGTIYSFEEGAEKAYLTL